MSHGRASARRVQGSRQALEVQARGLEERLRKERAARQQLEDHLKSLFRDYQAARADAEGLRGQCAAAEEEKSQLRRRLQECERSLVCLQVRLRRGMQQRPNCCWNAVVVGARAALTSRSLWNGTVHCDCGAGMHATAHGLA